MSAWMNETATINPSAVNGNAFTHMNDPSAIMDPSPFMGGANPAQFNHQFTQQQMLAMQQNGQMRNPSPSFPTPMYQTNPVVPSKRPRQDSIASSPRQNPGMLPTSRAETPQQANFPGFQQPQQPQQQQQPPQQGGQPQYPHLQPNGSSNATPSPIMANQLRPGSVPQRVSTASPHPFSPASQQFPQSSPAPSEHGGTPQPNPYMQNNAFQQGFQGAPSPARPSPSPNPMAAQMMQQGMGQMPQQMGQMPNPMMAQQMMQQMQMQQMQQLALQQMQGMPQAQLQAQAQQQKILYQRMLQQQLQQQGPMQMAAHMQGQIMAQGRSQMPKQPGQMPNGQMPPNAMRPQQPRPQANPEAFIKNLTTFMTTRGKQINPTPLVDGRPIHLMNLFQKVLIHGGYKHVTGSNQWSAIAVALGFPPPQHPMAGQQLKGHYETNLYEFEGAYQANANQKKMPAPPQPGVQMGAPQTPVKQQMPGQAPGPQISPAPAQGPQPPSQTPVKPMPPGAQQVSMNGFATPQLPHAQPQSSNTTPGHTRNSLSRSLEPGTHPDFPAASPAPGQKQSGLSPHGPQAGSTQMAQPTARFPAPFSKDPEEYMPCSREITTVGGVDLNAFAKLGREVELYRPDVPPLDSMGTIDIAALTRSLQCGIHGEIRMALDVLATLTSTVLHGNVQHFVLQLEYCDELLEALVDLGEDQVDDLVEDTVEVSDEILITSYEDVVRACRLDKVALRVVHAFGTPEHKLDQAANRLICITTILRNLSFTPENYKSLADEVVIKFICVVIRYLGTHNMLLRTNSNSLDLMKDLVILLSNIAHEVELPGREQALCLLQFLLAFAPGPVPTTSHERLFFTPYDPALHPYLPPAVDALAKLLARDQPNRTFYKAIFAVDAQNSAPYELITRTFALAIAPIPDQTKESRQANLQPVTKAREPFLMQGLLAADIVASLAPGHESGLTRGWLSSGNGFAQNLFRLIRILSSQFEGHPQCGGRGMHRNKDDGLVYMVRLGVSMLRKLSEKARDPSDPITSIPPNVVPSRDTVYGALQMQSADWSKEGVLKDIIAYAALED